MLITVETVLELNSIKIYIHKLTRRVNYLILSIICRVNYFWDS